MFKQYMKHKNIMALTNRLQH